jgi:hypothetical protein
MFLHICCKCFTWMLRIFAMVFKCFSCGFASVSDACFKCFMGIQTYVSNVASICFKSRSGYCTCCNGTHLSQPQAAAAGASSSGRRRRRGRELFPAWSSGAGPPWARKTQARRGVLVQTGAECRHARKQSVATRFCTDIRTLALPLPKF